MKAWKTIADFLQEDPSLTEKYTYEDFTKGKMSPENSDDLIEDVFEEFDRFIAIARREKEQV